MTDTTRFKPRDLEVSRYNDLRDLVSNVFSDGVVTPDEANKMAELQVNALETWMVVNDMLNQMSPQDKGYDRLKQLQVHLRRGWQLLNYANKKADSYNKMNAFEKNKEMARSHQKQELNLGGQKLNMSQMALLISASHPENRDEVIEKEMELAGKLVNLSESRSVILKETIVRTLIADEKEKLTEFQLNRMLDLGYSR